MRFYLFIAGIFFFSSCGWEKHEGYSNIGNNVYFKLISFNEGKRVPSDSDIVSYHMKVFDETGTIVFSSIEGFPLGLTSRIESSGHGWVNLEHALKQMEEGDSASFLIGNPELALHEDLRKITSREALRVDVKLLKVRTRREYDREMIRNSEVGDVQEYLLISDYLKEKQWNSDTIGEGIYMVTLRKGKGECPARGDKIRIKYKGYFLGGEVFDEGAFEFQYGEQMQVIKGMEMGLAYMREGGKAKIIIPSYLAYGEKGSSNGSVPPSTPVVYEVERVELKIKL